MLFIVLKIVGKDWKGYSVTLIVRHLFTTRHALISPFKTGVYFELNYYLPLSRHVGQPFAIKLACWDKNQRLAGWAAINFKTVMAGLMMVENQQNILIGNFIEVKMTRWHNTATRNENTSNFVLAVNLLKNYQITVRYKTCIWFFKP